VSWSTADRLPATRHPRRPAAAGPAPSGPAPPPPAARSPRPWGQSRRQESRASPPGNWPAADQSTPGAVDPHPDGGSRPRTRVRGNPAPQSCPVRRGPARPNQRLQPCATRDGLCGGTHKQGCRDQMPGGKLGMLGAHHYQFWRGRDRAAGNSCQPCSCAARAARHPWKASTTNATASTALAASSAVARRAGRTRAPAAARKTSPELASDDGERAHHQGILAG